MNIFGGQFPSVSFGFDFAFSKNLTNDSVSFSKVYFV
jgi:hypothetical protein